MSKIASKLCLLSAVLFVLSCAVKRVEVPVYDGVDVRDVLRSKSNISSIETRFSITFEKEDTEIKGDGLLNISRSGDMNMRIYSFGFLAFELASENGIIRSSPVIDRNKGIMLTHGLRDCLFWWDIKDFDVTENEKDYLLMNSSRKIWIDRRTMLPVRQTVSLEDGRELDIFYENPEVSDDIWYPSKIRIELSRYAVVLRIKDISFIL